MPDDSYDAVPYESYPFRRTHPDTLALVATLFGMTPPPVARCRVLELGCAAAGNLVAMALGLPDARFVGIDLSRRQIDQGRHVVETLGLANVELHALDVMDLDAAFGVFDYVIAHGLFSWVPQAIRDKVLAVCADHLAPDGVAYVSYNTYPGWHQPGMVREMMAYHARQFDEPLVKAQQARSLLRFLADAVGPANPYGQLLAQEFDVLKDQPDYYVYHEYLEAENTPLYFHQFVEQAAAQGLQYVADVNLREMTLDDFPTAVQAALQPLAANRLELEQYLDFLRNRRFRHTLLCHAGVRLVPRLTPQVLFSFHAASLAEPLAGDDATTPESEEQFRTPAGDTWRTASPLARAALRHLRTVWPAAVPVGELVTLARNRLSPAALEAPAAADASGFAADLLHAYATGVLWLYTHPPACAAKAGACPVASPLAPLQATAGADAVATLYHTVARINEFERQVLVRLDGSRDRDALIDALADLVRTGVLVPRYAEGRAAASADEMRDDLASLVEECLTRFAGVALLM
jgi:methyltransferase-like protein/2-polyprenyl-3-methyl-5-hydroxy-6-metoxy-1,4-benzoquinol methylase